MRRQKSYYPTQADQIQHKEWLLIDAKDAVLGRLASEVASFLRGKHKAQYSPSVDMGDYVVIINSDSIAVTGKKEEQKMYYRHSGFAGGFSARSFKDLKAKDSRQIIRKAVEGMLPHNRLGRAMINKLKIYQQSEHPHEAQNPKLINLKVKG